MKCFLINARTDPNHVSNHELYDKIKVSRLSETSHQIVECLLMFLNMRLFRWAPFSFFSLKNIMNVWTLQIYDHVFLTEGVGKFWQFFANALRKVKMGQRAVSMTGIIRMIRVLLLLPDGRLLWLFSLITLCYCCHRDGHWLQTEL